ncbi:MAG: AraC family transcriptional regulator [Oscillospiraceae bacterium]
MSNTSYSFEFNKKDGLKAKLISVSKSSYGKDWHSIKHTHNFTEFFYILKGSGKFLIEENQFSVTENDLIIINPHVWHTEKPFNNEDFEYIVLGVSELAFNFNENGFSNEYTVLKYQKDTHRIFFYLNEIIAEAEKKLYFSNFICQNLLEVLIIDMLRKTEHKMKVDFFLEANACSLNAKKYMDNNFKEPISLEDLAEITHVNKFYLSHTFTKDFNISPINYLITKRINESCNLLETTNLSVSEIALISGFSSPSYFTQIFKKATLLSPLKYRNEYIKRKNG